MIRGPCGVLNPDSPCMADGVCTKGYPKQFREATAENADGYPIYRRRDNANHVTINGNVVDNRWIVPYNPYLTKKYNALINVEICSSFKSIKYIFKYVYKGHDCAKVVFENNGQGSITWDEIKTFLYSKTGRSWWFCDSTKDFSSRTACTEVEGFKESINTIAEAFKSQGPFDGILGFSQGGALAALICALKEHQVAKRLSLVPQRQPPYSFVR
ncbi:hypothetical protein AVEN_259730-1, partial [Araneus ventricosus]